MMASGRIVKSIPRFGDAPAPVSKLLIVIPYYEGDKDAAEQLMNLIADLEKVRNHEADIFISRRHDATEISKVTASKLGEKFDKVNFHLCRRKDASGHPYGANQMFFDVVTLFGQLPQWQRDYYAFLFLEPDAVPTRPGWIGELCKAFKEAMGRGKSAIGYIHSIPVLHLNGVAIYSTDIYRKVPGDRLGGGDPRAAFDIEKAPFLMPMSEESPLFYFEYRRPSITPAELFGGRKFGVIPAIFHGVKDSSARDAVRARFISFDDKTPALRQTIYTYYQPVPGSNEQENQGILAVWAQAWKVKGFNPVVLRAQDAVKNARYASVFQNIDRLPTIFAKQTHLNRFLRWVALDSAGGGLISEFDVLPGQISSENFPKPSGFHVARPKEFGSIAFAFADKSALAKWLDRIQTYDPQPNDAVGDRKNVTDVNVMAGCANEDGIIPEEWTMNFIEPRWQTAQTVHFNTRLIQVSPMRNRRKSEIMAAYLRGELEQLATAPADSAPDVVARIAVQTSDEPTIQQPPQQVGYVDPVEEENAALKKQLADQAAILTEMKAALDAMKTVQPAPATLPTQPPKNKGGRPRKHPKPETAVV